MTNQAVREALEAGLKSHLFRTLDQEGRDRLLDGCVIKKFAPGMVIMVQDEPGLEMYLILSGTVSVKTEIPGGTVELAELGRGGVFGEVSVLTGCGRTATVTASTEVEVAAFPKKQIDEVLAQYPKVRELLDTMIEGRARNTIEKIIISSS